MLWSFPTIWRSLFLIGHLLGYYEPLTISRTTKLVQLQFASPMFLLGNKGLEFPILPFPDVIPDEHCCSSSFLFHPFLCIFAPPIPYHHTWDARVFGNVFDCQWRRDTISTQCNKYHERSLQSMTKLARAPGSKLRIVPLTVFALLVSFLGNVHWETGRFGFHDFPGFIALNGTD